MVSSELVPRPSRSAAPPEQGGDLRARAWRYAFDCYVRKKGAHPSASSDAKENEDVRAKTMVPRP